MVDKMWLNYEDGYKTHVYPKPGLAHLKGDRRRTKADVADGANGHQNWTQKALMPS